MSDCAGPRALPLVLALTILAGAGLAPAETTDFGSLEIITEPGATIFWDDHSLGPTNDSGRMTVSNIPLGSYSISLRHDGSETVSKQLDIEAGNQTLLVPMTTSIAPLPVADPTLPDPFARRSAPLVSVAFVSFLVAIAAGALWLGRRRRLEAEEVTPLEPEGPRVVMANEPRSRRRAPGFYKDLRQRETVLENLEERGPDRPRPKIIELPVADHRPLEEDG